MQGEFVLRQVFLIPPEVEKQGPLMAIAHSDARKLLNDDPRLESERGLAARHLLWLMEKSKVIKLIKIG